MSLISSLKRHVANQQLKNMYVKLEKHLKEVTILHFLMIILHLRHKFLKINEPKNINVIFVMYRM